MSSKLFELELELSAARDDRARLAALQRLAFGLERERPARSREFAREAVELARRLALADEEVYASVIEAGALRAAAHPNAALAILDPLLERAQGSENNTLAGRILVELGAVHLCLNLLEHAKHYLETAIALFTRSGDTEGIARSNWLLGRFWIALENWSKATACIDRAEAADYRLPGGNRYLAALYSERGQVHALQGRYDDAVVFLDRAIDWAPSQDDTASWILAQSRKGVCVAATGDRRAGSELVIAAAARAQEKGLALLRLQLAAPLARLLLDSGEVASARAGLQAALAMIEPPGFDEYEAEIHRALADVYECLAQPVEALAHHRRCHELNRRSLHRAGLERRAQLSMTARLREAEDRKRAAEDLSRTLEQRVAERTADLQRVVHELEREVRDRERAEQQVRYLANHDALTGLPNRTLLHARLSEALAARETEVAVLFIDLDGFKPINDSYGHSVGDRVLREIADRLRSCLGSATTLARYGGDEFVMVVTGSDAVDTARQGAERVIEVLRAPFNVNGRPLFLTCAIGIATAPGDGLDVETLVQKADTAMYHAKEQRGTGYAFHDPAMSNPAQERLALVTSLRLALQRGEFVLHYQPRIAAADHRVVGVEALIRWKDPERGLVMPGEFIAVAEQTGIILDLGRWVIREACRQARAWTRADMPRLPIAVNLSARQLTEGDIVADVRAALADFEIPPQALEFEITESMLMNDQAGANSQLTELRRLGVKVALDDFGTGYSNLAYLSRLAIDFLKIDRSFVNRIAEGSTDRAIVEGMVAMAHALSLTVIAEGVETAAQIQVLRAIGCDQFQGYHFSPALPLERIEEYILTGGGFPDPRRSAGAGPLHAVTGTATGGTRVAKRRPRAERGTRTPIKR